MDSENIIQKEKKINEQSSIKKFPFKTISLFLLLLQLYGCSGNSNNKYFEKPKYQPYSILQLERAKKENIKLYGKVLTYSILNYSDNIYLSIILKEESSFVCCHKIIDNKKSADQLKKICEYFDTNKNSKISVAGDYDGRDLTIKKIYTPKIKINFSEK